MASARLRLCPAFVATPMTDWTGLPAEEKIQPEDIVELARALLRLTPRARVPEIVIERVGDDDLTHAFVSARSGPRRGFPTPSNCRRSS